MQNPTQTALLNAIHDDVTPPQIVEERGNVTYIGYAAPGCISETDHRWSIKRISKTEDADTAESQTKIEYADESKAYNKAWSNRLRHS